MDHPAAHLSAEITIARVVESQIPKALDLLTRAFGSTEEELKKNESMMREQFDDKARKISTFVAVKDNDVIGMIRCYPNKAGSSNYVVSDVIVTEAFRNRGLGRHMMKFIEDHIAQQCLKGNKGAVILGDSIKDTRPESTFYEKLGYTPHPDLPVFDGKPLLQKILNR